jgi:signal transduction histidine kinase
MNPRNHILSSASSNSSGNEKQRDGKSPATLKYLSKGFNTLADEPINLTNLKSILADEIKAQSEFLELINACVSHELRNPLNSIVAQNTEKFMLYKKL